MYCAFFLDRNKSERGIFFEAVFGTTKAVEDRESLHLTSKENIFSLKQAQTGILKNKNILVSERQFYRNVCVIEIALQKKVITKRQKTGFLFTNKT